MSDQDPAPVEPAVAPPQPAPKVPATTQPVVPDGFVEKARFDGLVLKVQELTLSQRKAQEDLVGKSCRKDLRI